MALCRVWDLESGDQRFEIAGDGFGYKSLSISADGRFAVCKKQRAVRVIDQHTRQERLMISHHGAEINDAAVTPDGRYVLTAGSDGALEIWNLFSVGAERALILDPCQDDPENYLVFSDQGLVASIPPDSKNLISLEREQFLDFDRGQITIDTFGLNRSELVEERRMAAEQLRLQVREALEGIDMNNPDSGDLAQTKVNDLVSADYAYSAMRRQLLPNFIDELQYELQDVEQIAMSESVGQKIDQYAIESDVYDQAFKQFDFMTSKRMETDIEDVAESDVFLRSAMISRVEIQNFRCLDRLSFDFSGGSGKRVGWKVLLGENGAGKSSVLQAVALAMMGKSRLEKLKNIDPLSILKRGTEDGYVKVYFSTEFRPIELLLTPNGFEYRSSDATLRTYLLGFGSARWLPREGSAEPELGQYVRIRNLFNPFVPLTDALKWLANLKNESLKDRTRIRDYQKVEAVLARLLLLEPETRFLLREGIIYIQRPEQTIAHSERLDQLSDGYQTILAIAAAIMEMLGDLWQWEMEAAEGLVLLDEIGAHLHPRWKLRIVESLRSAFPRMQFIATTHEPLCLRGLEDGEIIVMRKNANHEVVAVTDLPSVEGLRVDQLLTSEHFGLLTTRSYETEERFTEYYDLLAKKKLTQDDETRLAYLERQLEGLREMGVTRRERLMLKAIDRYLAQEPEFLGTPDEKKYEDALEKKLDDIVAGQEEGE